MPRLQFSLACWDYDRTRALAEGSVRPEGIELIYHNLLVEETFFRMLRNREFDAASQRVRSCAIELPVGQHYKEGAKHGLFPALDTDPVTV